MSPSLARKQEEPRRLASIVGGRVEHGHPVARHSYRLGAARAPQGGYIVNLMDHVPGVSMVFEASTFEHAFERALVIGADMADASGHLAEGVVISIEECGSLAAIGLGDD